MKFSEEVRALFKQYQQNIKVIREESTLEIFTYILKKPNNQVRPSTVSLMQIGKFYIIRYNYNGNKLWCPILTIPPLKNKNENGILERQLKIVNNKNVLYAVNFDYLPLRYKALLIEAIIKNNDDEYNKNSDKISSGGRVREERNFKVHWVYDFLKRNGKKNYAVTAFDILKIEKVFEVSSTILQRFVFFDTYYVNKKLMYDTLQNIQNEKLRNEFSNKIKMFEEILEMYDKDVENFFTSLRNFEKNLKLMDEL